ncbi:M24 family metallopeptidase, partial [Geminicoccus harenae]|uniref:M24 family metallopeptidase n=1 Tax=Geminicoccus harenae TaxID=2498453 RepID=UPI001CC2A605
MGSAQPAMMMSASFLLGPCSSPRQPKRTNLSKIYHWFNSGGRRAKHTGRNARAPSVPLHRPQDFPAMRRAGRLAAATLAMIAPLVREGATTRALDAACESFIRDHGARPAPLGYQGYPFATCMSPNEVVCHGM